MFAGMVRTCLACICCAATLDVYLDKFWRAITLWAVAPGFSGPSLSGVAVKGRTCMPGGGPVLMSSNMAFRNWSSQMCTVLSRVMHM